MNGKYQRMAGDEVDVDGVIDEKGIRYIGKAVKLASGKWSVLADVQGCLCVVEVNISIPILGITL